MGLVVLVAIFCTWPVFIPSAAAFVVCLGLRHSFSKIGSEWFVVIWIIAILIGLLIPAMQRTDHARRRRPPLSAVPAALPDDGRVWSTGIESLDSRR